MAGILAIAKEIRVSCPCCGKALDLSQVAPEIFRRILNKLCNGERVEISRFGRFKMKQQKGRKVGKLKSGVTWIEPYKQISFKTSEYAKRMLNKRSV